MINKTGVKILLSLVLIVSFLYFSPTQSGLNAALQGGAPGTLKWSRDLGNSISSPVLGPDGTIYVVTSHLKFKFLSGFKLQSDLAALDRQGNTLWRYRTSGLSETTASVGPGGQIYMPSHDRDDERARLLAIDSSGEQAWTFSTRKIPYHIPAIDSAGNVFLPAGDLYALDSNGDHRWRQTDIYVQYQGPSIGQRGNLYVPNNPGELVSYSLEGRIRWSMEVSNFEGISTGTQGMNYIVTDRGVLKAIDSAGEIEWSLELDSDDEFSYSPPSISSDGTLYVNGTLNGTFSLVSGVPFNGSTRTYAVSSNGELLWTRERNGSSNCAPLIGDIGIIYTAYQSDTENRVIVEAISPENELKWRARLPKGKLLHKNTCEMALGSSGTLFISASTQSSDNFNKTTASDVGTLFAIRTDSDGLAESSWPKRHGDNSNSGRASF